MALMMRTTYEALVEGGRSADTAKKAAEEVADYQKQLPEIRIDLTLVKTLLGVATSGVVALVIKALFT